MGWLLPALRQRCPGDLPGGSGFDRVLAIYPTLRAALTAPRASAEDTRSALGPATLSN